MQIKTAEFDLDGTLIKLHGTFTYKDLRRVVDQCEKYVEMNVFAPVGSTIMIPIDVPNE